MAGSSHRLVALGLLVACGTDAPPASDRVVDPGPAPLRRLTVPELRRTVRDLFPGVDLPDPPLPADASVNGFEADASSQVPSALWVDQLQRATLAWTRAAMEAPEGWLPCAVDGGPDPLGCGLELLDTWGPRALRRPMTKEERSFYADLFTGLLEEEGFAVATPLLLQALLQDPSTLYLLEWGSGDGEVVPLTDWELASRLSYALWGTLPDDALFAAAAEGRLHTPEQLEEAVWTLLADPRARDGVRSFHRQWLDLARLDGATWDPATYPRVGPEAGAAMAEETLRFVEWAVLDGPGTVEALLLDRTAWLDPTTAGIYALPAPTEGWERRSLPGFERAGVLTRAGFLAGHAHAVHPSPVQRGAFVLGRLLCQPPGAPPAGIDLSVTVAPVNAPETNRERYQAHAQGSCAGCHTAIDGLGFAFEGYDAVGAWRTVDAGHPVDASATLSAEGDLDGLTVDGALDLSARLAASETVQRCVATQWFRYALRRTEGPEDAATLAALGDTFVASGGDLRQLLAELVRSDAFRLRRAP